MPEIIYSQVEKERVLLSVNRSWEITTERTDLCPSDKLLQVSTKSLPKGATFRPHKHNTLERHTDTTHEAWIILKGAVKAFFWDINDVLLHETVLREGDCVVVFGAGHSFDVLQRGTVLYEIKNGPYHGQTKDKTFIEGIKV